MKKKLLIILAISMIFTTGCWDMIEIEDRLLPYTVAIDLSRDGKDNAKRFFICFSYPNINALTEGSSQEDYAFLINANADSIFGAVDQISSRTYNPVFLKHLKVIVLSDQVAQNEQYMREILDGLKRDYIINKMIDLVITRGSAYELLVKKLESSRQQTIEGLFTPLLRNEQRSNQFTPMSLKDFIYNMDHKKAAIIPLASGDPEIEIAGGGLFKDYRLIGFIDADENRNISLLNGDANTEDIDFEYNGANLSLSLSAIRARKKLVDEENLKIQYQLSVDAQVHQYVIDPDKKLQTTEVFEDIQNKLAKIMVDDFNQTIERLQKEFNADALGILEYLYKFHPKIYKEVEKDWDSIFPYIDIEVDVDVKIRRRGLSDY